MQNNRIEIKPIAASCALNQNHNEPAITTLHKEKINKAKRCEKNGVGIARDFSAVQKSRNQKSVKKLLDF